MQSYPDKSNRLDEIKTQFRAREGYYRLMNSPDYSQRSQRAMGFGTGTASSNSSTASHEKTSIKISLVRISENLSNNSLNKSPQGARPCLESSKIYRRSKGTRDTKICFNVGRELFVYNYDGVRAGPDASNPIYKRSFKGSAPTCHDFNQITASSGSLCLLVGFSHGQVQLINLNDDQESCQEFNADRLIDKSRVTCVKWLPNSSNLFLVAHASGQLYLYKDDLPCGPTAPVYQVYKQSEGVVIYTCKTKTTRNPIYRWSIGAAQANGCSSTSLGSLSSLHKTDNESCSLNEFVFSPCAKYLACVSQDGFLRVYCYATMELVGRARSYYGGLSCVCWSPDGKYVVTGGEDDLITVWSFVERRVVARGIGHKSWISVVAFDSYYTGYDSRDSDVDNYDDDDEEDSKEVGADELEDETTDEGDKLSSILQSNMTVNNIKSNSRITKECPPDLPRSNSNNQTKSSSSPSMTTYRFGSVGQDTQLCLWDLSDDLLQQPVVKSRVSCVGNSTSVVNITGSQNHSHANANESLATKDVSIAEHSDLGSCDKRNESLNSNANNQDGNQVKSNNATSSTSSGVGSLLLSKGSGFTKTFSLVGKRDKRYINNRLSDKNSAKTNLTSQANNGETNRLIEDPVKLLGSSICPRMNEVPIIEPTVCKKISFERLTSLIFCQGGFITSCQDGYVFSWARPSRRTLKISPGQSNEELRVIDVGTSSAV